MVQESLTQKHMKEEKMKNKLKFTVAFIAMLLIIAIFVLFSKILFNMTGSFNFGSQNFQKQCSLSLNEVPILGNINNFQKDGNILVVSSDKELLVYDICKGEILSRFQGKKVVLYNN